MNQNKEFISGIVSALNIVAEQDYGTLFKEIIESFDRDIILKEIYANGLEKTKRMAKFNYPKLDNKTVKRPEIIIQEEHFDEKTGKYTVLEYDANGEPYVPKKPMIMFETVNGCVAVDWTPEVENVLGVAGIEYTIIKGD